MRSRAVAGDADRALAAANDGALHRHALVVVLHHKADSRSAVLDALDDRARPVQIVGLLGQLEGRHQRHLRAAGRIGARHGARPQPSYNRRLAAVGQFRFRIQVSYALERLIAHPLAVVANVVGKSCRAAPRDLLRLTALSPTLVLAREHAHRVGVGIDWRLSRELWRKFDERLVDEHCDRVEVGRHCPQPKPLRFKRYGAAARKRVVDGQRLVVEVLQHGCAVGFGRRCFVLGARHGARDFVSCFGNQPFIAAVLPLHKPPDEVVQPLALDALFHFSLKFFAIRRVVHHAGEDDGATCCERTPCPPQMQR